MNVASRSNLRTGNRLTLPTGPVWEEAKVERNWFAYAIVPQPGRKPLKQPANVRTGWAPEDAKRVAIFDFAEAAEAINALNRRLPEINRKRAERYAKADGNKANHLKGGIARFVMGYLPRDRSALVGLDFDNVLKDGRVEAWAKEAIAAHETFAELSSSGTGIRMLVTRQEGDTERHGERRDAGIIATEGKGFALTFQHRHGSPREILAAPKAIATLTARMSDTSRPKKTPISELKREEVADVVNPVEWMADVYAGLTNTLDYDDWVKLGHAFKAAETRGVRGAFEIFEEFSGRFARGEITPGEEAAYKWAGFNPRTVDIGTIWYFARKLGWDGRNPRPGILPERLFQPDVDLTKVIKALVSGDASALSGVIGGLFFQADMQGWVVEKVVTALCAVGEVEMDTGLLRKIEGRWIAYVEDIMSGAAALRRIDDTLKRAKERDIFLASEQMTNEVIANRFMTIAQRLNTAQIDGAIAFLQELQKRRGAA
jgi:hypothetical protein